MKPRILIVDDNATNRKLASDTLAYDDFDVSEAPDATSALATLARYRPDLILMDIAMPGMDGLSLTRVLKADTATRHIPIVALTASAMRGDEAKARDAGCDGYITKPINTRIFGEQVRAWLRTCPADENKP
jgi:CheY-like chemotaxis protein